MKILLLNDEFYTTGASIAMLRLAERLVQHHEVYVMPRIDGQGDVRKKFEALGIPIVKNIDSADVIVSNCILSGAAVADLASRCPVVWWIHEAEIGRDLLVHYPQMAAGFKKASHIVFQTEFQRIVYGSFLFDSPAATHVLPFWNDAIYRQEDLAPKSKDKKRIVCIGTIEQRKRMEDVIMAVNAMDEALRDSVEVLFIGKYLQMSDGARRLAEAFPNLYRFMGELPNEETLRYLASADAYVLASNSESQPLTIWEAFELEVPVCLSDLETYRHIGLRNGVNALMHPVGNIEMLSSNLRMLLTSDEVRRSVSRAGKSLLLGRLASDWADEFERIIYRAQAQAEIKSLGY
ncbi:MULTISPECIES: glycosyltransferase family 4 protein [unclassified Herbaspirillum]|uniref:glycosyltransferase family 4 protein n=1 Tax=unclassified Herbaspirillum TaxID=2624150 RepID=UPI00114DE993|nr:MULTISPECIES: glycosyltransferase family 4 protein [unclassified Herbaspirillum]MBB5390091.1 glycosyltransferase involved in cell wall biosynthesis [Herbaspirillum sp. SJZ102]TQK09410.1 glycosyl transferase family 4 [Herbaspirillum sp. SJZ130]TQK13903.1 glycosyl transferase family 4 [Herbaspirillum sp. SJZ106]TWC69627.1 glycosyl transferase family 4 [Herbaspirillum sp. SJZ099]